MTPVRALIAGIFAAVLFGAGLFIAAGFAGARPHDLVPILSIDRTPFNFICFLAAWTGVIAGVLGVFAAFFAFLAPEEEDDPRFRRRGFPKIAPLVLIALSLGLTWFALRCAGVAAHERPIAILLAPEVGDAPEAEVFEPPENEARTRPEARAEPPAPVRPFPIAAAADFQWAYEIPLAHREIAQVDLKGLFDAEAQTARLLCGKAWVAVTGSASEEGPTGRNETRARRRAAAARAVAADWIAGRAECGATPVFAVSLGQHANVLGAGDDGAASAYQRQVLTVSRDRMEGETMSADAAEAELRDFLDEPHNLDALYAGRRFASRPEILP